MQFASKPTMTLGKYRHYKGNEYQVLDLVLHSETEEWMVLYRPLYGDGYLWVRPYSMFLERVQLGDESWVDRFALITE